MTRPLEQLLRRVAQDMALQDALGEPKDGRTFATRLVAAGAMYGHHFTVSAVEAALREGRPLQCPSDAGGLARWVPARLNWAEDGPRIEWCFLGGRRFTEPFFEDTLAGCRLSPLARLLRVETPIEVLEDFAQRPGLTPAGFIFHMSRCGSTLIAQMLAALRQDVVLSEPEPLDAVLNAGVFDPHLTDEQQVTWLRGVVHALGRRRHAAERHLFLKFDCWHVAPLPLVRRAFPDVPRFFVYRDPVEVLVSHRRQPGRQMVPDLVSPQRLGLEPPSPSAEGLEEYRAQVLGRICETAAREFADGSGTLIEYRQLPEFAWTDLPVLCGLSLSADDRDRMRDAARFHAKSPHEAFSGDSAEKHHCATPRERELAARHVQPHYERLEALRRQAVPAKLRRT